MTLAQKFEEIFGYKPAAQCVFEVPCRECKYNRNGCKFAWNAEYKEVSAKSDYSGMEEFQRIIALQTEINSVQIETNAAVQRDLKELFEEIKRLKEYHSLFKHSRSFESE